MLSRIVHFRARKWLIPLALLLLVLIFTGCNTLTFYSQALKGQYRVFAAEVPVEKLLANTNTPPALRQRLALVLKLREFAERELHLPVDDHYRKYADLGRRFVVWNVQAAPEFSLEPKTWWYPLVGSLEYRGYFSETGAVRYAEYLRKAKKYETFVGGTTAYST